jgi:hypothetical protein
VILLMGILVEEKVLGGDVVVFWVVWWKEKVLT